MPAVLKPLNTINTIILSPPPALLILNLSVPHWPTNEPSTRIRHHTVVFNPPSHHHIPNHPPKSLCCRVRRSPGDRPTASAHRHRYIRQHHFLPLGPRPPPHESVMSSYYHYNAQQHTTTTNPHAAAASHHGGRSRRAPRLSSAQNSSHKQFRGVRSMKELTEAASVTTFRQKYEAGRSFDLDDDLEFCPGLLTESDVSSQHTPRRRRQKGANGRRKPRRPG